MGTTILYETDFKLREALLEQLASAGITAKACYSLSKLQFDMEKDPGKNVIVFVRKDEKDLDSIMEQYPRVFTFTQESIEFDIQALQRALLINEENRYQLDFLVIGSSTGGLPVLQHITRGLHLKTTIVVICQHVSQEHTGEILAAISKSVRNKIQKVDSSTELQRGNIYVLSGGNDYEVRKKYHRIFLEPVELGQENYHPSFNVLTKSLNALSTFKVGCIILSGLGDDGSKYLNELKKDKVKILVQEPKGSVAPFMPKAAISTGHVDHVYNQEQLHDFLKRTAV